MCARVCIKSHLLLKPLHSLVLGNLVSETDISRPSLAIGYTESSTTHNNVEVHPVDTNGWVVLYTQINMLLDTKTKVALIGEVLFSQFVFANFESLFEYFLSLSPTHGAMDSYLLITTNAKRPNSVTSWVGGA